MIALVGLVLMAFTAGAEIKRKTWTVFSWEKTMDKVYNLFTQKNGKTETEAGQEYSAPYWLQIVHAHGFEKALRGVVNTLKHGGQLVAEVNVFALYNKGVRKMNAIPWKIGNELSKLNTQFECACTQNPHEGIASCTEVLEIAIERMVEEHHRHNAYLDRLASDAEIELDAEDERRWPSRVI